MDDKQSDGEEGEGEGGGVRRRGGVLLACTIIFLGHLLMQQFFLVVGN